MAASISWTVLTGRTLLHPGPTGKAAFPPRAPESRRLLKVLSAMPPRFDTFFQAATSPRLAGEAAVTPAGHTPYDYQRRLACGERDGRPETAWLAGSAPCSSRLISIPTGLGKIAAAVGAAGASTRPIFDSLPA